MSRTGHAVRSLASGYVALAVNALYTLASVPLALHYLGKKEFGLWATVSNVAAYMLLLDLGMTGSVSRFLLDYKDDKSSKGYRSVLRTGSVVLALQGLIIAALGCALSLFLPGLLNIEATYARDFRNLIAGQSLIIGTLFSGKVFLSVLQANQRYDMQNYAQIIQLAIVFSVQWITFHLGYGVYSLLMAFGAGLMTGLIINSASVRFLRLGPTPGNAGRASWTLFREMFSYGRDLLLIGLGLQLLNASQAIIITASLGLEAAGLWAVATKAFQLVLQFVQRIFDYTGSAFGEMIVRQEIDTLSRRFRDVLALTAGVAVFACVSVAVANAPFVTMLSHGKYSWEWRNDALVAILIFCNSVSRCYVGLSGYAKQLGRMRWVYLLEGICFVIAASIAVRSFGISGIIAAAIISNLAWSGWYGLRWTGGYLHLPARHIIDWLLPALRYMVFMTAFGVILWRLALHLPAQLRFVVSSIGMLIAGLPMLWFVGFGSGLRAEILAAYRRLAGRQK